MPDEEDVAAGRRHAVVLFHASCCRRELGGGGPSGGGRYHDRIRLPLPPLVLSSVRAVCAAALFITGDHSI